MTTLYHGSHTRLTIGHEGQCFTDDADCAETYAGGRGVFMSVEIDLDSLTVEECDGYDRDTNEAPADSAEFRAAAAARGVDILVYDDESESGRQHTCWRIVSARAMADVVTTAVIIAD